MGSYYAGHPTEVRALSALITLLRAAESVSTRVHRHLGGAGLTVGQFGALEALYHRGPLCQHELGRKLLRTPGDISTIVRNLERRRLVQRVPDPADGRRRVVRLTPAGRRLVMRLLPPHVAGVVAVFRILRPAEQEALRGLCRRLGRHAQHAVGRTAASPTPRIRPRARNP